MTTNNNLDSFLPPNYSIPVTSNYMKFTEGVNTFRVLSSAITGWEYFTNENKSVRQQEAFESMPSDIKKGGVVKPFWAFLVYNYEAKRVQILVLAQKGIMKTIQGYVENEKWGDPKEYDFLVTREGSGIDTEYSVAVNPKNDMPFIEIPEVNLDALYSGDDPFASK